MAGSSHLSRRRFLQHTAMLTAAGEARLLLVVDQLEELFTIEGNDAATRQQQFVAALRRAVVVPVVCFDERFTSVLAGGDDARAAAHLLTSYLQWKASARPA